MRRPIARIITAIFICYVAWLGMLLVHEFGIRHAGNAGDMQRLGTPVPVMITFGTIFVILGLLCWHYTSWLRIGYWQKRPQDILK